MKIVAILKTGLVLSIITSILALVVVVFLIVVALVCILFRIEQIIVLSRGSYGRTRKLNLKDSEVK